MSIFIAYVRVFIIYIYILSKHINANRNELSDSIWIGETALKIHATTHVSFVRAFINFCYFSKLSMIKDNSSNYILKDRNIKLGIPCVLVFFCINSITHTETSYQIGFDWFVGDRLSRIHHHSVTLNLRN